MAAKDQCFQGAPSSRCGLHDTAGVRTVCGVYFQKGVVHLFFAATKCLPLDNGLTILPAPRALKILTK